MPRAILVTTDLSELSASAYAGAARLARALKLPIRLLHVVDHDLHHAISGGLPAVLEQASRRLDDQADRLRQRFGAEVQVRLRRGNPFDNIMVELGHEVELLVMATHGAGGFRRFLLGSTSRRLLQRARRPMLIVPPHATVALYDHMLVATDLTTDDGPNEAMRFAKALGARVTLLYVLQPPEDVYDFDGVRSKRAMEAATEARRERAEARLEALRRRVEVAGVTARARLVTGRRRAPTICSAAEDFGADLLVLVAHGTPGFARFALGSVTDEVSRRSDVPLLALRAPAEGQQRSGS